MNKISFLIIILLLIASLKSNSQYLINVVNINSLTVELNAEKVKPDILMDEMLIPSNSSELMIYKNDFYSYWIDFKLKQCGKKVKLKTASFILSKDGTRYNGMQFTNTKKVEEYGPGFIVGEFNDVIKINDDNSNPIKTSFNYVMRYMN